MAGKNKQEERKLVYDSMTIPYTLVRSDRSSYSISISEEKGMVVRTPYRMSELFLEKMFHEKEHWITTKFAEVSEARERKAASPYSVKEREDLKKIYVKAAKDYFPKRVKYYVNEIYWDDSQIFKQTNLPYVNITIREQKTRWGSCSSSGTLSFNWRLMLAPPRILDYVVVHELCHFKYMDHSKEFWSLVESVLPDYRERRKWLKEHGNELYF